MMKRIVTTIIITLTCSAVIAQAEDSVVAKTVQCAQKGNDVCQTLLGKWIFEGSHGYQQDYGKAVAWWMQAAKQNNDEATAYLGFCYQFGWGVEADSATAAHLFVKALKLGNDNLVKIHDSLANNGTVFSAMLLAHCYKMAICVRRDAAAAQKYYVLAAKQGNREAMREAGILMRTAKEDAAALDMFKQAMERSDIVATYYYGKMLCEGRGTTKDMTTGVGYIQQAADKGYAAAQYELAEAYAKGYGVAKDASAAFGWYRKAALGGNRAAWWQLAECYREGHGTAMDYEEALECYAKAWSEGYHNKLTELLSGGNSQWKNTPFLHYLRGMRLLKVENNPDAAMKEFGKLSKQMNVRQTMESLCLLHPSYVKKNEKKAVKQLQKLAVTGDHRATYELALLQMRGEGMDKDVAKAEKALRELAKQGYAPAINYLADSYFEGRGLKQNKTQAILLYLQAEQVCRLSSVGALRLSDAFRDGDGMKVNTERAEELRKYRAYDIKSLLEKVSLK